MQLRRLVFGFAMLLLLATHHPGAASGDSNDARSQKSPAFGNTRVGMTEKEFGSLGLPGITRVVGHDELYYFGHRKIIKKRALVQWNFDIWKKTLRSINITQDDTAPRYSTNFALLHRSIREACVSEFDSVRMFFERKFGTFDEPPEEQSKKTESEGYQGALVQTTETYIHSVKHMGDNYVAAYMIHDDSFNTKVQRYERICTVTVSLHVDDDKLYAQARARGAEKLRKTKAKHN
jgi:hypothetical protein